MAQSDISIVVRMRDLATRGMRALGSAATRSAAAVVRGFRGALAAATRLEAKFFALAAPLLAFFSVAKFKALAQDIDDAAKNSRRFGVTTESYLQVAHAAELSGAAVNDMDRALRRMRERAERAAQGNATLERSFATLGISYQELRSGNLDLVETMAKVADQMVGLEDNSAKVKIAMDIFGRAGTELLPMLENGGDAIRAMASEAERLGLSMGAAQAKRFEDFNDALTRVSGSIRGTALGIASDLLPEINELLESLSLFIAQHRRKVVEEMAAMARGVGDNIELMIGLFVRFSQLVEGKLQTIIITYRTLNNVLANAEAIYARLTKSEDEYTAALLRSRETHESMLASFARLEEIVRRSPEDAIAAYRKMRQEMEELAASAQQAGESIKQTVTTDGPGVIQRFLSGAEQSFEAAHARLSDVSRLGRESMDTALSTLERSMGRALEGVIDGTVKARDAFKQLGNDMLAMLIKVIAKLIVAALLTAAIGGLGLSGGSAGAGAGAAPQGITAGGRGIPAGSGAGPQGLPQGGGGFPAGRGGGGGGGGTPVQITIMANDTRGFDRLLTERSVLIEQIISNAIRTHSGVRQQIRAL